MATTSSGSPKSLRQYEVMQRKIKQLEESLQEAQKEIYKHESEKAELRKANLTLSSGDNKRSALEGRIHALREEIDNEKRKAVAAVAETERIRSEANVSINRWKAAEEGWTSDNTQLRASVEHLTRVETTLRLEVQEVTRRLEAEKRKAASREAQLDKAEATLAETVKNLRLKSDAYERQEERYNVVQRTSLGLEEQIRSLEAVIQNLEAANTRQHQTIRSMEESHDASISEMQQLRVENQQLRQAVDELQGELNRLGDVSSQSRDLTFELTRLNRMQTESETTMRNLADARQQALDHTLQLQSERQALQHVNQELQSKVTTLEQHVGLLERDLTAVQRDASKFSTTNVELTAQKEQLLEMLDEHKLLIQDLKAEIEVGKRESLMKREAMTSMQAQLAARDQELQRAQDTVRDLETQVALAKQEYMMQERDTQRATSSAASLAEELEAMKTQQVKLEQQLNEERSHQQSTQVHLEQEAAALLSLHTAACAAKDVLETEVKTLSAALEQCKEEVASLQASVVALETSHAEQGVQLISETEKAQHLNRLIADTQAKLEASEAALLTLQEEHSSESQRLNNALSETEKAMQSAHTELMAIRSERDALLTEVTALRNLRGRDASAAEEQANEANRRFAQEREEKNQLAHRLKKAEQSYQARLETHAENLANQCRQKDSVIESMQTQIKTLTAAGDALQRNVEKHKREADNAIDVKDRYKAEYNKAVSFGKGLQTRHASDVETFRSEIEKANQEILYLRDRYQELLKFYTLLKQSRLGKDRQATPDELRDFNACLREAQDVKRNALGKPLPLDCEAMRMLQQREEEIEDGGQENGLLTLRDAPTQQPRPQQPALKRARSET